jgi:hypothetical protein
MISLERTDILHKSYIAKGHQSLSEPAMFTMKASVLFYEPLTTSFIRLRRDHTV